MPVFELFSYSKPERADFPCQPAARYRESDLRRIDSKNYSMLLIGRIYIYVFCLLGSLSDAAPGVADQELKDVTKPVLHSRRSVRDFRLTANPQAKQWLETTPVFASSDNNGKSVPLPSTEIRSRWTRQNLYLLFTCPYDVLHLKPQPDLSHPTSKLWEWDVAEAFIGSDPAHPERYREFEMSPQGEWLDLAIDLANRALDNGPSWDSGFRVKAQIDAVRGIWYGEMRIPFSAFDGKPSRLGLFRMQGTREILWIPTQSRSFHVPESFGTLQLEP